MKILTATSFLLMSAIFVSAGTAEATSMRNEISVKASTGGNTSTGEVVKGKGEASVFIETTVDGEVVQRIEETKQSEAGEPVEIEKHVEYKNDKAEVKIQTQANVEVDIEDEDEKSEPALGGESKPLMARVVEFFRSIFSWFFA